MDVTLIVQITDVVLEADMLAFVKMAVELAEGGRFTCAPNPCVGGVIVNQGKVIIANHYCSVIQLDSHKLWWVQSGVHRKIIKL